uniref:Jacalin-related lectin n=1 Tax=Pteria penguin TaxID=113549 RepID=B6F0T4_PTEPN|nr:jacalin-related lectin [Pteria penguin]
MSNLVFLGIIAVCLTYPCTTGAAFCSQYLTKVGGNGGGAFDESSLSSNGDITAIQVECGNVFTSIKVKYGSTWGTKHGWGASHCSNYFTRGNQTTYTLEDGEYITGATITHNAYVNSIIFKTNKRNFAKCGWSTGAKSTTITGRHLKYINGRSGCIVDSLSLYWPQWS